MSSTDSPLNGISVILPSLNPDEKLIATIRGLIGCGFQDIIVIDDGSGEGYQPLFARADALPEVTVLTQGCNRGKGRALKTGFAFCAEHRPDRIGAITADSDGQYAPEDVRACAELLTANPDKVVLGARNLDTPDVPPKRRRGNRITRIVFRLLCGIRITDTQTGLRAIPAPQLRFMSGIAGDRFDYETNMLLEIKKTGIEFVETPVRTVRFSGEAAFHFNPVTDSLRIYAFILRYALSSFSATLLDLFLFWAASAFLESHGVDGAAQTYTATAFARVISASFNYVINKRVVFRSRSKGTFLRFVVLCVLVAATSASIVSLAGRAFAARSTGRTAIKVLTDFVLFFVGYTVQREWVFKDRSSGL